MVDEEDVATARRALDRGVFAAHLTMNVSTQTGATNVVTLTMPIAKPAVKLEISYDTLRADDMCALLLVIRCRRLMIDVLVDTEWGESERIGTACVGLDRAVVEIVRPRAVAALRALWPQWRPDLGGIEEESVEAEVEAFACFERVLLEQGPSRFPGGTRSAMEAGRRGNSPG